MKKRTAKQNRRYKLHQSVKKIFRYSAAKKTVFVIPEEMDLLSKSQLKVVNELRDRFGYNIQTEIR